MNKLFLFFVLSAGFLASIFFFLFYPIAQFPQPTGQHGVGTAQYHWIDTTRQELNSQDSNHPHRKLMVHVYYPTEKDMSASPVAYGADAAKSTKDYFAHCSKLPSWLFSGLKLLKVHAQPGAPLAKNAKLFPVVIFSHGAGGPIVQSYTYMLEELASHGFIVVGINHPYVAQTVRYPDGRVVASIYREKARNEQGKLELLEANAQDVSFVITKINELSSQNDPLWAHADVTNIGMLGHSFGGRTTVRATRKDNRITCGVNLEGGIQDDDLTLPFTTPFMFMIAEKSFLWNKNHPHYKKGFDLGPIMQFASAPGTHMKMIAIKGVGHSVYSDAPLQLNATLFGRLVSRYAGFGLEAPAGKATEILVNEITPQIISFFEQQLNPGYRETIFDKVVSIPKELMLDIPQLPPHCDQLPGLKKGFAAIKDGKLYYEEEGQGIPIVLISGGPGCTHHGFHPYFSQLKDIARIIYYDQRGIGKSSYDDTGKTYTIKQAVDDLESLRKTLKIKRWTVLGWSYGGLLAQCYALTYPDHCTGLILGASNHNLHEPMINPEEQRELMFISPAEQNAIERVQQQCSQGKLTTAQVIYNKYLAGDWKRYSYYKPTREALLQHAFYGWAPAPNFEELMRPDSDKIDLKGKFDDCTIPTLIVEAQWDLLWWNPNRAEVMRSNHPHARVEMFEKSGHMIFADEPEKFFSLLRNFLWKLSKK